MADTFLQFNSPAAGSTVEETFTVSGTAGVKGSRGKGIMTHCPVTVQFGDGAIWQMELLVEGAGVIGGRPLLRREK